MTTAATSLLGLALPVQGELSGTWGDVVNTSLTSLLDSAIAGTTTISTDADITLSTTTLAANEAREAVILWTAGGSTTRYISAPAQSKTYIVINKTSGTQSIVIRAVGPTTGVTVPAGRAAIVAWNGVDFVAANSSINGNAAGYLEVVQNAQAAGYTLVAGDAGKQIYFTSAGAFTIPANASVAFPIGTAVTFVNMTGSSSTIAITSDTMYLAGVGSTGTRTLANFGLATALKMTATTWIISGSGLT
jgi:hypothetical protein